MEIECLFLALTSAYVYSAAEIREVLLQVAVYCGVPAGIDSVRIAREAFAELDQAKQG